MKNLQMNFVWWAGLLAASIASAQDVSVSVDPQMQSATLGAQVTVAIRLDTQGKAVEIGGVFLQFDRTRLSFADGINNTAVWNNSTFDVVPLEREIGIVSLNVGATIPVNANGVLVSTLRFNALASGTAALTLLFNMGAQETIFYQPGLASAWATTRVGGTVTIMGASSTPTRSPTNTPLTTGPSPTRTSTPTSTVGPMSCADAVIRAVPDFGGGPLATEMNFLDPLKTLGPPDGGAYSLSNGGLLEVRFVDNSLTNSGDDRLELGVFEVGGNETFLVALRPDAATLALISSVGTDANQDGFFELPPAVSGSPASIDIDRVFSGFARGGLRFDAVQLIDVKGTDTAATVGADINAVCAIDQPPTGTTSTPTRTPSSTPTRTSTRTPTTSATATRTATPTMTRNAPRVVLSNTTSSRGATAPVGASLEQHGQALVAVQLDLGWDHDTPVIARANGRPDCTVDPAIQKPDSTFAFIPAGCQGASCTAVRALVFSVNNVDLISDHAHLFTCNAHVAATAAAGPHPVSCSGASGSGADANTVGVACDAGQISIVACKGDCDGSSFVDISEVVRIVNIALGGIDLATCPIADGDGDGAVTISDIIAAVNSILTGCPGS